MKPNLILVMLVAAATFAGAQDISGDWQGTLSAGGQDLRLVLHLTKAADNSLKATLDSLDQPGANGIPVNSVSFKDSKLSLDVAAVHGTYEGKLSADGKSIAGIWSQGMALPLEFKRSGAAPAKTETKPAPKNETNAEIKPAKPSDIDGAWMGTLDTGSLKLRVVFHIVNTADGLTATMDSLDQGMNGMTMSGVTRDGASLKIDAKKIGGSFEGKIAADLSVDRRQVVARRRLTAAAAEAREEHF